MDFFGKILAGLVGALAAFALKNLADSRDRRRKFRASMRWLIEEIKLLPLDVGIEVEGGGTLVKEWRARLGDFRKQCYDVFEDIPLTHKTAFEEAVFKCCKLEQEQLEPKDIGTYPDGDSMRFMFPINTEAGRVTLLDALAAVQDAANESAWFRLDAAKPAVDSAS